MGNRRKGKVLKANEEVFLTDCEWADTAQSRAIGLLGRSSIAPGSGLWITPCISIHMFFMKFAIDAAFLSRSGEIVALYSQMKPWRHSWIHFSAIGVLEVGAGEFEKANVKLGDRLVLCPSN